MARGTGEPGDRRWSAVRRGIRHRQGTVVLWPDRRVRRGISCEMGAAKWRQCVKRFAAIPWGWVLGITALVGIPVVVFIIQARHSGLSVSQQWQQIARRWERTSGASTAASGAGQAGPPRSAPAIPFLEATAVGQPVNDPPRIAYVTFCDLDRDGRLDILYCDDLANRIGWVRQGADGTFTDTFIGPEVAAPAHVEACDVDGDGDLDLLVASMGILFPSNDRIGAVIVLQNDGGGHFSRRVVVDRIARVTDVRGADFDGDGDTDLVAGQFGYDDGEIRWIENLGGGKFRSHILLRLSGTIHTPVADVDGDGDLDFIALVSQEWEEIYLFENDGKGRFRTHLIYGSTNEDFGSSGIDLVDLDRDGDLDVLYTNGDAFDYIPPRPRPWHGLQWLENKGELKFVFHRIGDFAGASVARAADFDHDGDLDIVVCSAYNFWERPDAQSLVWFQNDGKMQFVRRNLARSPTHLIALAVGDVDGDGWMDVVTGGMHVYPPYDREGRITLWRNRWPRMATARARSPR